MTNAELAESILRKAIGENGGCYTETCGIALFDTGWFDVTDEERTYLDALCEEIDAAGTPQPPEQP